MYIVQVIPLINLPRQLSAALSYFYKDTLPPGTLVEVEFRKKKIPALVIKSIEAQTVKSSIKKTTFAFKPIIRVLSIDQEAKPFSLVNKNFLYLVKFVSDFYYAPFSLTLKRILPNAKSLVSETKNRARQQADKNKELDKKEKNTPISHFQILTSQIKTNIAEIVKQNKQVLLLVPTGNLAKYFLESMREKFGADPVVQYSFGKKISEHRKAFWEIKNGNAKIVIGTRSAVFAPFENLGAIFVYDPENVGYKSWDQKPFYNACTVARKLAELWNAAFQTIDLPNTEKNKTKIIVYAKITDAIIPAEFTAIIEKAVIERKKILIFVNRRGIARYTLCRDCGYIFMCKNCSAPLTLHKSTANQNDFICHHCGNIALVPDLCPSCQGLNIKEYGIGVHRVVQELEKKFPASKIMSFEKNDTQSIDKSSPFPRGIEPTQKGYSDAIHLVPTRIGGVFWKGLDKLSGCDIVIATEALLNAIDFGSFVKWDFVLLPFFHQSLIFPDLTAEKQAFDFLRRAALLGDQFVVGVLEKFKDAVSQMLNEPQNFIDENLEKRKIIGAPPFMSVIKIVVSSKDEKNTLRDSERIHGLLEKYGSILKIEDKIRINDPLPAFIPFKKNLWHYEIIMRHAPDIDIKLRNQLLDVIPDYCKIDVEPKSLI